MSEHQFPELPAMDMHGHSDGGHYVYGYTTDAMTAYREQVAAPLLARIAELEIAHAGAVDAIRDEMDEGLRLCEIGGALPGENITAMTERVIAERDHLQTRIAELEAQVSSLGVVMERAARLVEGADFRLGGVLSAESKASAIPSKACSQVKARHLASLRDAIDAARGKA